MEHTLTPELLLGAYAQGLFPMAYSADSPYVHWICPEERGQLSITDMHIPRSLKKTIRKSQRKGVYEIKINSDFEAVIRACAETRKERPDTWINAQIIDVYCALHAKGHAHSIEYWQDNMLAGGLYGLAIGGAFFGESMFSHTANASKIALAHLAARLWKGGFSLLDTQFVNEHLMQFGVYEIKHDEYMKRLKPAISKTADFLLHGIDEAQLMEAYLQMHSMNS